MPRRAIETYHCVLRAIRCDHKCSEVTEYWTCTNHNDVIITKEKGRRVLF